MGKRDAQVPWKDEMDPTVRTDHVGHHGAGQFDVVVYRLHAVERIRRRERYKDLCRRTQVKCTIAAQSFDSLVPALLAGQFDAIIDNVANRAETTTR